MKKLRTRIFLFLLAAIVPAVMLFQAWSTFGTCVSLRDASIFFFQRLAHAAPTPVDHGANADPGETVAAPDRSAHEKTSADRETKPLPIAAW